jgi:hypothetical protein
LPKFPFFVGGTTRTVPKCRNGIRQRCAFHTLGMEKMHPETRKESEEIHNTFEGLKLRFGRLRAAGIGTYLIRSRTTNGTHARQCKSHQPPAIFFKFVRD